MILYNNPRHLLYWGGITAGLGVIAVVVRLRFEPGESETLPGGSRVGLIFGILGGLLSLLALSLSLLRFVPSWWFIGSRAFWLKMHIWLGLLSFVLILCHTGLRFGGFFEKALYLVYFLVVLTGIFGLILQQFLPRWMTSEVPCEVPFEQIPYICATLREKADLEMEEKCQSPVPATRARINQWYIEVMRPFLVMEEKCQSPVPTTRMRIKQWYTSARLLFFGKGFKRTSPLNDASKTAQIFAEMRGLPGVEAKESTLPDLLTRLEEYCNERRRLGQQESLHWLLHSWLYVHVPLSWAMTVMMLAHAAMASLYYHQ